MLPDALEKHCIQAEPILDKNALASKKVASAHLLLWICRRFSTDAAVLRAFCRLGCLFADASAVSVGLSACFVGHRLSARSCRSFFYQCRPCHFLTEDKKRASSVSSFCGRCRLQAGLSICYALAASVRLSVSCWQEVLILPCAGVGLATFLLKTKNTRAVLALAFAWPFQARSGVFPRAAAFLY